VSLSPIKYEKFEFKLHEIFFNIIIIIIIIYFSDFLFNITNHEK
jgi:hypothetical protein